MTKPADILIYEMGHDHVVLREHRIPLSYNAVLDAWAFSTRHNNLKIDYTNGRIFFIQPGENNFTFPGMQLHAETTIHRHADIAAFKAFIHHVGDDRFNVDPSIPHHAGRPYTLAELILRDFDARYLPLIKDETWRQSLAEVIAPHAETLGAWQSLAGEAFTRTIPSSLRAKYIPELPPVSMDILAQIIAKSAENPAIIPHLIARAGLIRDAQPTSLANDLQGCLVAGCATEFSIALWAFGSFRHCPSSAALDLAEMRPHSQQTAHSTRGREIRQYELMLGPLRRAAQDDPAANAAAQKVIQEILSKAITFA